MFEKKQLKFPPDQRNALFYPSPRINTYTDIDLLTDGYSSPKLVCKSPCSPTGCLWVQTENDSSFQNRTLLARMLYCFNSAFTFEIKKKKKKKKKPTAQLLLNELLLFLPHWVWLKQEGTSTVCLPQNSWLALWLQSANVRAVSEPAWDGTQRSKGLRFSPGKSSLFFLTISIFITTGMVIPKGIKQACPTIYYPVSYEQERLSLLLLSHRPPCFLLSLHRHLCRNQWCRCAQGYISVCEPLPWRYCDLFFFAHHTALHSLALSTWVLIKIQMEPKPNSSPNTKPRNGHLLEN